VSKKIFIFGASGHGKVVAEIAEACGYNNVSFFDDRWPGFTRIGRWDVVGDTATLLTHGKDNSPFIIAVGNNSVREQKAGLFCDAGLLHTLLIHPFSSISSSSIIGNGSVVMAGACINADVQIGDGVIINTGATVDHDCNIGHYCHLSPGVNLAGNVAIGSKSWIGIGSQIIQGITIGQDAVVGAGATVINDVSDRITVVGTPAKKRIKNL